MAVIVWVLAFLFCLNRLLFWVLAAVWKGDPNEAQGKVLYAVVGSTDLFWFLMPLAPQPRFEGLALVWRAVGVILFVAGVVMMRRGLGEFNKYGISIRPDLKPVKLVTEGVYGIVRHPLYISLTAIFLGWSLVWGAVFSLYFVLVFVLLNTVNAFLEERYILGKAFGEEHKAYVKRVGMFFPRLKGLVRGSGVSSRQVDGTD